jgi:uncharacterized protein
VKWKRVRSKDVVDVRGAPGGGRLAGGVPRIGGTLGVVAIIVVIGIQLLGGGGYDVGPVFDSGGGAPSASNPDPIPRGQDPQRDLKDFSTYVFVDAQDEWTRSFGSRDDSYRRAELVLYDGAVRTDGCGGATSAVGPFYCPADSRVYLDLSFYEDMRRELSAEGDFAWAYVIAHEIGHHVQNETGTSGEVERLEREHPDQANELSVRLELQADCYAGVWAGTVFEQGNLEPGDLDEAFTATEAVGDDRLQRQATGRVEPDTFTHGTSEQRRRWFERGYRSGDPGTCDTFSAEPI